MDAVAWRIARTVYPLLATVAASGICLNTIFLLTTITTRSLRSTTNILLGWCSLFDIIHQAGYFIQFPILFSDYYIDSFACSCMMFLPHMGLSAGAFCTLSIGIDRATTIIASHTYIRLNNVTKIKFHFLAIALFCSWTGYLMIAYWTEKKLICSMPSPFHGDALEWWTVSINCVNIVSALLYFATWRVLKRRKGEFATSERVFISIAVMMIFEVTGWFISYTLVNLSRYIAEPARRPPFHYCACLAVNVGIASKVIVYYSISGDYRRAIRSFLGRRKRNAVSVISPFSLGYISAVRPAEQEAPTSDAKVFASVIRSAIDDLFFPDPDVRLIAEPGRFFAERPFTLVASVMARTAVSAEKITKKASDAAAIGHMHYINDGVYGNFICAMTDGCYSPGRPLFDNKMMNRLEVGDWVIYENKGAYTSPISTDFNGFERPTPMYQRVHMERTGYMNAIYPISHVYLVNC